jgi:iron-sulfur cluster assembly protein
MLILTRPAIGAIEAAMRQNDKLGRGVRITAESGCCGPKFSMRFEPEPLSDDMVIEIRDVRVFLAEASMEILRGATVDYAQEGDSRGFNFTLDPAASQDAAQKCGCKGPSAEAGNRGSSTGQSCGSSTMH